jgi:hypothetical protein
MSKKAKAQSLAAGVVTSLAMAGFVASPATAHAAETEHPAAATPVGASQGQRPASSASGNLVQAQKDIRGAKQRGFVPKSASGFVITTNCNKNTCVGVSHSNSASTNAESLYFTNWPGVHRGHIRINYVYGFSSSYDSQYLSSRQTFRLNVYTSPVKSVCGSFSSVPSPVCVKL